VAGGYASLGPGHAAAPVYFRPEVADRSGSNERKDPGTHARRPAASATQSMSILLVPRRPPSQGDCRPPDLPPDPSPGGLPLFKNARVQSAWGEQPRGSGEREPPKMWRRLWGWRPSKDGCLLKRFLKDTAGANLEVAQHNRRCPLYLRIRSVRPPNTGHPGPNEPKASIL
jgi:hypothetical protein